MSGFQHLAERYRDVQAEAQRASNPILRTDVEMVTLPLVHVSSPVRPPKSDARPARQPPPVPASQKLPHYLLDQPVQILPRLCGTIASLENKVCTNVVRGGLYRSIVCLL